MFVAIYNQPQMQPDLRCIHPSSQMLCLPRAALVFAERAMDGTSEYKEMDVFASKKNSHAHVQPAAHVR